MLAYGFFIDDNFGIKNCFDAFEVEFNEKEHVGRSCPELASFLCIEVGKKRSINEEEAASLLKLEIANRLNFVPDNKSIDEYQELVEKIGPNWIITTNYDLIAEMVVGDKAEIIGPSSPFSWRKGNVPVYHMHGHIADPDSIIITQQDYTKLLRPNEYKNTRMPFIFSESVVVVFGYSITDVNVLSALDWGRTNYGGLDHRQPTGIFQIVRNGEDSFDSPVVRLSTLEITDFMNEMRLFRGGIQEEYDRRVKEWDQIKKDAEDSSKVSSIISTSDREERVKFFKQLIEMSENSVTQFVILYKKILEQAWDRTQRHGAFEEYADYLMVVIDAINAHQHPRHLHPVAFRLILKSLERVSSMIGDSHGNSFAAAKVWKSEGPGIPENWKQELIRYSETHSSYHTGRIFRMLDETK